MERPRLASKAQPFARHSRRLLPRRAIVWRLPTQPERPPQATRRQTARLPTQPERPPQATRRPTERLPRQPQEPPQTTRREPATTAEMVSEARRRWAIPTTGSSVGILETPRFTEPGLGVRWYMRCYETAAPDAAGSSRHGVSALWRQSWGRCHGATGSNAILGAAATGCLVVATR